MTTRQDELGNVRVYVVSSPDSADWSLIINVVDSKGVPIAQVGSCKVEEGMHDKLRTIFQAYRMGVRVTKEAT